MKRLKFGVALATLLMAGVALAPAVKAADCPVLIGPDWSGETLSPDPARLLSISDVYHARMVYEPFVGGGFRDAADTVARGVLEIERHGDRVDLPGARRA